MSKHNLGQEQQLAQKQIASQQTVQLMRMIELSNMGLEEEIRKAVDENPALEIDHDDNNIDELYNLAESETSEDNDDMARELDRNHNEDPFDNDFFSEEEKEDNDISDYRLYANNRSADDETRERIIVFDHSLQEQLLRQLGEMNMTDREYEICEYIVGNLDDDGYLQRDNQAMVNELLFTYNIDCSVEELEHIIVDYIQELEPYGVGARNLRECMLIQLKHNEDSPSVNAARAIIDGYFEDFVSKRYEKLLRQLGLSEEVLKSALAEIKKLDPRPANNDSLIEQTTSIIVPDFIISNHDGQLELALNNTYIPKVKINKDFTKEYRFLSQEKNDKLRADAEKFLKDNLDNANNFINLLSLREMILYNTMYAIMMMQKEYFLSGNEFDLKPMVLKDIAEKVNLDISTISRVTSSKYVQTPFGILLIKNLFSEAVGDEDVSSKAIKKILSEIIEQEDKNNPLPDEQLCALLKEKGYDIARRTVAKYREQLGLPVARLRREIQF
ncbi:MAG: RNA polymerase factor sigma-54 [Bacteroidales bacterium]|jgi:RNA polymerase sigma-54 factor|nr:RNA polymerase factor sigma-54 [Bacteroidales bacterium]